jgi:hypothetical protein
MRGYVASLAHPGGSVTGLYRSSRRAAIVRSEGDLLELVIDALRRYESELHGAQTPVQFLWHRQRGGGAIPVDENAFSDHVTLFLQSALVENGVIVNREVEVGRVPGSPVGDRTDIKVEAVRRGTGIEGAETIMVVIEAKGCWNPELMTAMENQLRDNYLRRLGATHGIFLVGWFDAESWDALDRSRRTAGTRHGYAELQLALDEIAASASEDCTLRAVIVDCHAPRGAAKRQSAVKHIRAGSNARRTRAKPKL